jgi:hypothetical protein
MNNVFARRFQELDQARRAFRWMKLTDDDSPYEMDGEWRGWATSVQNLLIAVFGQAGPHYTNFMTAYLGGSAAESDIKTLISIFSSAKSDFDGGYVFNVELRISGEVFGDFVALARYSLSEGNKDVAAVLACAALEDALKRYAAANKIPVDGKTMTEVVNALKSAGLVAGAQKTLLDAMPRIRNLALHGDWAKLSEPDVSSVLGFVEAFLLTKFSP